MSKTSLRCTVPWALVAALVLGGGVAAHAANDEQDGQVVKIGRPDNDQSEPNLPPSDEGLSIQGVPQQAPLPKYWIGLLGGTISPDSPLRAQLDLPENQGLIVARIVPDGPAAKAGLKQHDILLRANDKDLHEMQDLVELVLTEGPSKGKIALEVLRHNKRETVNLTPEERPANAPMPQQLGGLDGALGGSDLSPNDLFGQLSGRLPAEFRNFGPGVIVGGNGNGVGPGVANMPNGVSVSIQKQNDQPAHITVKRGSDTWDIVGDDPESLKKLPEDLRPFVEQMVQGHGKNMAMPNFNRGPGAPGAESGRVRERLERMEQRLEELQKRLGSPDNTPAEKPSDENESTK
jgi:membrane-associated protease RseP (regulator of RpoE activity)